MKCEEARDLMVEVLYGEAAEPEGVLSHLQGCTVCAAEWNELRSTHQLLQTWGDEEAPERLVYVPAPRRRGLSFSGRPLWKAAGIVLAVVALLALFNTRIAVSRGGLAIQFALWKGGEAVPVTQTEEEWLQLVQRMIADSEFHQSQQYALWLQKSMEDLHLQRQMELMQARDTFDRIQRYLIQTVEDNNLLLRNYSRRSSRQ